MTFQCDWFDRPVPDVTSSTRDMKRGKFSYRDQNAYTSSTGALMVIVFCTSTARRPVPIPTSDASGRFVAARAISSAPAAAAPAPIASRRFAPAATSTPPAAATAALVAGAQRICSRSRCSPAGGFPL
jgi:hypothetical protein